MPSTPLQTHSPLTVRPHGCAATGKMLSRDRVSLNQLAFESTCKLIEAVLARGVNLAEAYIDALGDTNKHKVAHQARPGPNL